MKKRLIVAAVLMACVFGFTGAALAAELSTSGTIEFKATGTSQADEASPLFGAGDVLVNYSVTLTSGTFEANLTPKFNLADEALEVEDAYIKWMPDTVSITMKPTGIDKELWDIEGTGGKPNIPSNPGMGFELAVAPFTFDVVVNNQAGVYLDAGDAKYSYALGLKWQEDAVTLEGLYGASDVKWVLDYEGSILVPIEFDGGFKYNWTVHKWGDWWGSYYGGKIAVDIAPLTVTGEFGGFSPEGAHREDGSGYFGEVAYALDEGLGTLTVNYTGVDKNLNGKGWPTAKDYSKVKLEYSYPVTDDVSLTMDVAGIEPGTGVKSYTEYGLKVGVSL